MINAGVGSDSDGEHSHEASHVSAWEIATPWLLLLGGFTLGVGWIVGVYCLWRSKIWSVSDKILGTLVWPGGIATVALYLRWASNSSQVCVGSATFTSDGSHVCARSVPWPVSNMTILVALFAAVLAGAVFSRLCHVRARGTR